MPIIGSNTSAAGQALFTIQQSQSQFAESLKRTASGSRLANPSLDAAGVAVSSRLDAIAKALGSVSESTQTLTSFSQTADGFLGVIGDQIGRMGELAIRAQNGALSDADRANLNVEFTKLRDNINNQISNASFNGTPVFDTSKTVSGAIDEKGNQFTLSIADAAGNVAGLAGLDITTTANAQAAIGNINTALDNITTSRAGVNSDISVLNSTFQTNEVSRLNNQIANSRISDTDVAAESVEQARTSLINQTAISVLSKSNQARQNVLALLR